MKLVTSFERIRLCAYLGILSIAVGFVFFCPALSLAAEDSDSAIGTLSDRYATLDSLSNSLNSDESVVIETRIGVLTLVNRALDGATVRFSGEAVGNLINAEMGNRWINVTDTGNSSIAVYMSSSQAEQVDNYGDYNTSGAELLITGAYHIACEEHQGELDVHAVTVEVADKGGQTEHVLESRDVVVGLALCVVGLVFVALFLFLRRRADRKEGTR